MNTARKVASRRRFIRRGMEFSGGLLAVPALSQTPDRGPVNETLKTTQSPRTIHGTSPTSRGRTGKSRQSSAPASEPPVLPTCKRISSS